MAVSVSQGFWLVKTGPNAAEVQNLPSGQHPLQARWGAAVYLGATVATAKSWIARAAQRLGVPNPQNVPSLSTSLGIIGAEVGGFGLGAAAVGATAAEVNAATGATDAGTAASGSTAAAGGSGGVAGSLASKAASKLGMQVAKGAGIGEVWNALTSASPGAASPIKYAATWLGVMLVGILLLAHGLLGGGGGGGTRFIPIPA